MLSKEASSTIFWVFGMTRPGIEPRSPGPLANTLTARPMSGMERISFWIRRHWKLICAVFKLHTKWCNKQCVSASSTTILEITSGTYHGLNCFGHVVYTSQTSTYQTIAKLLTHSSLLFSNSSICRESFLI